MDPRFNDETLGFLQFLVQNKPSDGVPSVESMRHFMDNVHGKINEKLNGTFKGNLEERSVKTKSTDIQISIYTPIDAKKDKLGIFFHGGGWVSGNRQSHQVGVNFMADATKTIWISVEYRLAPEYKYPIWLDDCCDVTQYIIENKTSFCVDATAKVGVAGDSAGGMIAASIARTIKNLDFQIIIYGVLDMIQETESYKEFNKEMYFLTVDFMNWFISNAFESSQDLKDPRISGLFNTSLEDVPPCLFIVSELDVLRDGNLEYQKLLDKAGVRTKMLVVQGVLHGFFTLPGVYPKSCAQATDAIRDFLATV